MDSEENSRVSEETSPEESPTPLSQIRTYQGDVASAISDQKESLVSIKQSEVAKKRATSSPDEKPHTEREKAVLLVLGAIILIALGSFGGWFTYQEYLKRSAPPENPIPRSRLITVTQDERFAVATTTSRAELIKFLRESAENVPVGEIKHTILEMDSSPLTVENFMRTMESRASGALVRSWKPIFMFGSTRAENVSSFMIIELMSFESAYAGMLDWEKYLASDIGPAFPSALGLQSIKDPTVFRDVITRNKDARALLDSDGREVLLYSFLDNKILIITDNFETLHALVARLQREPLTR